MKDEWKMNGDRLKKSGIFFAMLLLAVLSAGARQGDGRHQPLSGTITGGTPDPAAGKGEGDVKTTGEGNGKASGPTVEVSVITCAPGTEVYELYGHTAIRVMGTKDVAGKGTARFDSVWNYGVFDYNAPNFVGRFVKGDLRYMVAGYPFAWFMPEYQETGRRVTEQKLNLTPGEAARLHRALQVNALPQNATYNYDYVKDNCSTRVWDQITAAVPLHTPDTMSRKAPYHTFREAMRHYHSHYPWYSLGIDVALAYPVDTLINRDDALFLPEELQRRLAVSLRPDGEPIVRETVILNQGVPDATLPPTPWWKGPDFWGWMLFAAACLYEFICWRKGRSLKVFEALFFTVIGIAGSIIAYLVLFSSHRASSPNLLLIWLNPLALVVPLFIWSRRLRFLVVAYMIAGVAAILFGAAFWGFQQQSGNTAFLPVLATDILLSVCYIVLYNGGGKNTATRRKGSKTSARRKNYKRK